MRTDFSYKGYDVSIMEIMPVGYRTMAPIVRMTINKNKQFIAGKKQTNLATAKQQAINYIDKLLADKGMKFSADATTNPKIPATSLDGASQSGSGTVQGKDGKAYFVINYSDGYRYLVYYHDAENNEVNVGTWTKGQYYGLDFIDWYKNPVNIGIGILGILVVLGIISSVRSGLQTSKS